MTTIFNASVRSLKQGMVAMVSVLGMTPLFAHEFWIEPSAFTTQPGQRIELRLRVGESLPGDPVSLSPARVRQFIVQDAVERKPVEMRVDRDPTGVVAVARTGLQVVGYFSQPTAIELPAEKFNNYLKEEGLDSIIALRQRRNQTASSGKEQYLRCAKSLLLSGMADESADRRLGLPLEFMVERNPYTLATGQALPVRLLFRDEPVSGALVTAINSIDPSEKQSTRTDRDGRVNFHLRAGGMWLVSAVHMIEAPKGSDAEWISYWASLTFESPAEDARGKLLKNG